MSELSLMILCGRSPRHLYVANALCRAGQVLAIVQETGSERNLRKVLRKLRPDNLWRKAWRWLRDRRRYAGGEEATFFFGGDVPCLDRPELVHEVPHVNHPEVLRLARELKPDLICVFGTSLIRGELLREGRLGMVNLHGGLSPEYRGADCTFWALYNGEPENVGCTLHFINEGIDTGELIAHIRPAMWEGDTELPLFWRAVRESAAIYAQFVGRLAAGEQVWRATANQGTTLPSEAARLRTGAGVGPTTARKRHVSGGISLPPRVSWYQHIEFR